MSNLYIRNWDDFPTVEVAPNNFRKSICGLEAGVNFITVKHPMKIPLHVHEDAEQIMLILDGKLRVHIEDQESTEVRKGDIIVIPQNVPHWLESVGCEAQFYEVFAPRRVQNLIGFIGKIF